MKHFKILGLSLTGVFYVASAAGLQAQTITRITGTSGFEYVGGVGDLVTIHGTAFYYPTPVVSVKFNGVSTVFSAPTSDTRIQVQVPPGATTGPVTVQKSGGPLVFSPQDFTVIGPEPYVDSFSPSKGVGGTPVSINGLHFTSATAVQFNGVSISTFLTHTETLIRVNTPSGVTTGPLSVHSHAGVGTTEENFYVPPVIDGFAPSSGVALSEFTISGANFIDTTAITIGGINVPTFNVNANTQIVATVPFGAVSGPVKVTAPGGLYQTFTNFTLLPTITGFSPPAGTTNTVVTISGANLNVAPVSVAFNGVAASVTSSTFNQIVATAPASSSGHITVTTGDGSSASSAVFFYPPRITGFSPGSGGEGTSVGISGSSFTNATSVLFDGVPALTFTVSNNSLIEALAPNNVTTGPLTVSAPGGVAVSATPFYAPATFTGFLPSEGFPGTDVILFGANFDGASAVAFNGTPAAILSNTGTQIGTRVPTGATTGLIGITTPAGTAISASSFTVPEVGDLRVNTFLDNPDPVFVEGDLTLTIVPANSGPDTASNVTASVTIAPGLSLKSASSDTPGDTVNTNSNPVVFNLGTLTVFDNPTLTLVLVPQVPGSATNTVTLSSDTFDPDTDNNTDFRVTTVVAIPELSIDRDGVSYVRIAWPESLTSFILQSKPDLTTSSPWANVPTTPTLEGDEWVITEPSTGVAKFYRLKD